MVNYTAKYMKIESGYMGQLVEWPEVVTEGKDLEECRESLRDALNEMILAYRQMQKEIPQGNADAGLAPQMAELPPFDHVYRRGSAAASVFRGLLEPHVRC
jgi:predicted RNase H-like HicB family nuclease